MTIWLLALILTAIACAALYYAAAGRTVNAGATTADAATAHFRAQLREIDVDAAAGRLGPNEAVTAKAELAREIMRAGSGETTNSASDSNGPVLASIAVVAVLALGTYGYLGHPELPAEPLAGRMQATGAIDLEAAARTIEARLVQNPTDLRGWQVVAPVYMQLGRYADAVTALRHVNDMAPPTAQSQTDLGEALMMQNGGSIAGEPLELFRKATELDPNDVRSRFYVAGEETRTGDNVAAVRDWNALLALGKGGEPWMVTARNGLAAAEAALNPSASSALPGPSQIEAMVDGLEARLKSNGGTIDEWTRLVRSRMVQGRMADAQADYDLARKAYPDKSQRTELDVLAADNGLVEQ